MAKLVFDIETTALPIENFDEEINNLLLMVKENADEEKKEGYRKYQPFHEATK